MLFFSQLILGGLYGSGADQNLDTILRYVPEDGGSWEVLSERLSEPNHGSSAAYMGDDLFCRN